MQGVVIEPLEVGEGQRRRKPLEREQTRVEPIESINEQRSDREVNR